MAGIVQGGCWKGGEVKIVALNFKESLSFHCFSQKEPNSMKINYPTLAVLSVFVLFAGLLLTHQPVLAQGAVIDGELTKVDATAKTLSVKDSRGQEMEFRYTDQTQISGAEGGVEGLATKSGTPVRVHYDAASKTATKIEIKQQRQK